MAKNTLKRTRHASDGTGLGRRGTKITWPALLNVKGIEQKHLETLKVRSSVSSSLNSPILLLLVIIIIVVIIIIIIIIIIFRHSFSVYPCASLLYYTPHHNDFHFFFHVKSNVLKVFWLEKHYW